MKSSDSIRVRTEHLRVGCFLRHPVFDENDVMILPASTEIIDSIKQALLDRQILDVFLHPEDGSAMFSLPPQSGVAESPAQGSKAREATFAALVESITHVSEQIAPQLEEFAARIPLVVENVGPPLRERSIRIGCEPYNHHQHELLTQQFATTKKLMDTMIRHAVAGLTQDTRAINTVAKRACSELVRDSDQAYAASAEVSQDPGLNERTIRTSVLAMATAIEMGWDEDHVREVGECGLVHDWGLHRLPEALREKRSELTFEEQELLIHHPLHTFDLLSKMQNISDSVRISAAQVHERLDGSGYPRGLTSEQIHPYAKIVHVADTYVSLTEETWGRPAYIPYDVMTYLLSQVRLKRVSSEIVKSLLEVVSLFPIGSHVTLSDGTEARVIRRGQGNYTEPVVQRLDENRKIRLDEAHDLLVDLSKSHLKVSAPLPHPIRKEQRLDEDAQKGW
ncbi:HD-GYP domain-containing protein [Bythopirellula polymerisocia]|uniref:Cyclic di-GMP phosphodiesterase response regulator RpfG n=1 Tax=Bythopirellula polymerisocia TaxID=2528003 RepID=A0A5C6CFG1_9BACT|nr:HD domain-containing phosphohydrolase [Bythopirellula polymerisocia]TWU23643.1 Cyclic di-GMP phosphodiesterase response regulator RpfG [Bythopirellula polymerisocia]